MRPTRVLLAASFAVLACAPALAQPAPVPAAPAPVRAAARPLLWRVADADSRVYLLGSVHTLRPGTDVLPGPAASAFDDAEAVAFEVDFDAARADAAAATLPGMATDGVALSKRLGPADAQRLARRIEPAGLSLAAVEAFKPWLAAVVLMTLPPPAQAGGASGLSADAGADAVLFARAAAEGKPRLALETIADQVAAFDGMPDKDQLAMLRDALGQDGDAPLTALVDAWEAGDEDALAAIVAQGLGRTSTMRRLFLTDRNALWVPQIEAMLARESPAGHPEDVLVVVGVGHLVGPGSVVELLRARGLMVTRM